MRTITIRLPGGLRVLLLNGPRAVGIVALRPATKLTPHRRALLEQLEAYHDWWHAHQRLRRFSPRAYEVELARFLGEHAELAHYRTWWIATREQAPTATAIDTIVTDLTRPANLRVPAWLDRYLASHRQTHPPATATPVHHGEQELWPY